MLERVCKIYLLRLAVNSVGPHSYHHWLGFGRTKLGWQVQRPRVLERGNKVQVGERVKILSSVCLKPHLHLGSVAPKAAVPPKRGRPRTASVASVASASLAAKQPVYWRPGRRLYNVHPIRDCKLTYMRKCARYTVYVNKSVISRPSQYLHFQC